MVVPSFESTPRDDIDTDAEEVLKILKQADMIEQGGARLKVHQKVQVATWVSLASRDRTEHSDPRSPAPSCDAEDLRAAAAESLKGEDIIGHPSRVSPQAVRGLEAGTGGAGGSR